MRLITRELINQLIEQAGQSERKRVPYRFHEHTDPVQRMINAIVPGSYITPHKHENPDKVEMIAILAGKAAVVHFSDTGQVQDVFVLDENGPIRGVDIPPRLYHNFVALTPCAVLEIIQGPYQAETHKKFASWAPHEGAAGCPAYLERLEALIESKTLAQDGQ
jgi:cupin fold WbuC family metalloprotein